MKTAKYLLIGGGLASGEAAKKIREKDPQGIILMVGDEPYVPYHRPHLSKEFLRGEVAREKVFFDPEKFYQDHKIDLSLGVAVQKIDPARKTVHLADGEDISFEKALIATGGRPVRLNIPGSDLSNVFYLRTLDDSANISAQTRPGTKAVIIGAGFIGMEIAASLTRKGARATVIETQSHIWPRFADPTLAGFFQDYCTQKGVTFITNDVAAEIRGRGKASLVFTRAGRDLPCDVVCIGVGIVPNVEPAQEAGLEVKNGIIVDEYLRCSHPDIYAAGDVVNYPDPYFNKRRRVEHWGHAEYTGKLAGENMAGGKSSYDLLTYVWSDIFDLHLEFAGDESEHDEVLVRGRFQDQKFTVLYLKKNVLTAYFDVNGNSADFSVLQDLIRNKKDLSSKKSQIQDPEFALKGLL